MIAALLFLIALELASMVGILAYQVTLFHRAQASAPTKRPKGERGIVSPSGYIRVESRGRTPKVNDDRAAHAKEAENEWGT